ncbi:MAG: MBL fold metallo-hydrolase [Planctomycetota bacterium]|nr:MAG: MBL fold metallo-hydrolase [Planctomycetota bacterium]
MMPEDDRPCSSSLDAMPDDAVGALCVLASGSRGNCSVLVVPDGGTRRVLLLDAGLSPKRTQRLLADHGIELWEIDAVLFTHLDTDHAHLGWARRRRFDAPLYVHAAHRGRADRLGITCHRTELFRERFTLFDRIDIEPALLSHDALGVCAFRISIRDAGPNRVAQLGFATDVGRPSEALINHVHGCDVLGIESNYCPRMQLSSPRPEFLKRRIMGGAGHLSNQECLKVVEQASPRSHVVLLHLSQQCNDPAIVRGLHQHAAYETTISSQHAPTPWVWLHAQAKPQPRPIVRTQPLLWAEH